MGWVSLGTGFRVERWPLIWAVVGECEWMDEVKDKLGGEAVRMKRP